MKKNTIRDLITLYFENQTDELQSKNIPTLESLLDSGIILLHKNDTSQVVLNPISQDLNKELLEYCKSIIEYTEPQSVEDVITLVELFINQIKDTFSITNYRTFRPTVDGFTNHLLTQLKNKNIDVYSYACEKVKNNTEDHYEDYFDAGFIFHLLNNDYSIEQIYTFCEICTSPENYIVFRGLMTEILTYKSTLIYQLYQYGNSQQDIEQCEFQLRLIPQLYVSHTEEIFRKIYEIIDKNRKNGIKLLGNTKLTVNHIENAINTAKEFIEDSTIGEELNNLCYSLTINEATLTNQRIEVYQIWITLSKNSDKELCASIVSNASCIKNEEDEYFRYILLVQYLNKSGDLKVLNNFFRYFKDPQYVYKLLGDYYQSTNGRRLHILKEFFERPLRHFFKESKDESERLILDFFNPKYKFGMLPLEIIMSDFSNFFKVDLLKIKDRETQLSAIKKFYFIPYNFDKLIPILIPLWKSPHIEVVKSLQFHLAMLAYESYGKSILEWIEPVVKGKGATSFLKPIKAAAEDRENELKEKFSIKDINPMNHEKDLYELYMSISHESQTKALENSRNNPSFLMSHFKNSVIVRGNSAKVGGIDSDVVPLGNVSVSMIIDSKLYKNPDLFELQQNNIE